MVTYDAERIAQRSRMISIGVDARQQRFPHEPRFVYEPLIDHEEENRWNEDTRENVVKNYSVLDFYI